MCVGRGFGGVHHLATDQPVRRHGDDTLPQFVGVGAVITDRQFDDFLSAEMTGGRTQMRTFWVAGRRRRPVVFILLGQSWVGVIGIGHVS